MTDKEIIVLLILLREQLDLSHYEVIRSIINEKIKRLGFKLSGELIG